MGRHLRASSEFQKVYRAGKRYDGSVITVFVLPNSDRIHRLGVTASRRALGKAVDRNRAKRLLRESFLLNRTGLGRLKQTCDWVLNAKRKLVEGKVSAAAKELEAIIQRVASEQDRRVSG